MVVQVIVQFHTGLHNIDHLTLVTFFKQAFINSLGCFIHRAERTQWVQHHSGAPLTQLLATPKFGLTEFSDVCQNRHIQRFSESAVVFFSLHSFSEDAVSASFNTCFRTFNRRFKTFLSERISTGHDEEIRISSSINSRFDTVDHFFFRYDFFVRAMTTTLLSNLIFDMHCSSTGLFHLFNGASDVECAPPTRININQQRQRACRSNTTNIFNHVVQRRHTEVWQAVGSVCNTTTGEIDRLMANFFSHHRGIRIDGTYNLQRLVIFKRLTEFLAWGHIRSPVPYKLMSGLVSQTSFKVSQRHLDMAPHQ